MTGNDKGSLSNGGDRLDSIPNDDKNSTRSIHLIIPGEVSTSNYPMGHTDICKSNGDALTDSIEAHKYSLSAACGDGNRDDHNQITTSENNKKRQKLICYDFQKGICRRRICRYPHVMNPDQVVFCHDYQNNGCFRASCKFIHRHIEDEDYYREYGFFSTPNDRPTINPMQGDRNHYQNGDNGANSLQPQYPTQPQHPAHPPHPAHPAHAVHPAHPQHTQPPPHPQQLQQMQRRRSFCDNDSMPPKRIHLDDDRYGNHSNIRPATALVQQSPTQVITSNQLTSLVIGEDIVNIVRLMEEQNILRRRMEASEERMQELRASNQYLLQQNEKILNKLNCSCTKTIVSPVTLTTASQSSTSTQVISAVSIAPVHVQSTPIVSIASISQAAPQIITSTTPIAIANTTQGQSLTLTGTRQAGQIIATPQITLATGPTMGITVDTHQPLAISANATQPIISIPVVTHSILPH